MRNVSATAPVLAMAEQIVDMIDPTGISTVRQMVRVFRPRLAFFVHRTASHTPEPLPLLAGDVLILARARANARQAPALNDGASAGEAQGTLYAATDQACGAIEFENADCNALLSALPERILIGSDAIVGRSAIHRLFDLIAQETAHGATPCAFVLDALAAALFAMVIRHHLSTCDSPGGLLGALCDPRLGPALAALHAKPANRWQLRQLAALANMSSSAFTKHFRHLLGRSPLQYLAEWRMTCANALLNDEPTSSVAQVAASLGYATEAGFRRAFKRFFGVGPGHIRRQGAGRRNPPNIDSGKPRRVEAQRNCFSL